VLKKLFQSFRPAPRAAERLAAAKDLQKRGELRAALAACGEALALGADAAAVELQLGVLHAALAEREQAEIHLRKAIALAPEDPDPLCMLGTVLNDLQRFEESTLLFERAHALRPDFAEAHFNLGLARFEQGDLRGAVRSFGHCALLNRGEPWNAARRAELSRDPAPPFPAQDMAVNAVKLGHDCEQIGYLLARGRLPDAYRDVLEDYRSLLGEVRGKVDIAGLVAFDAARHPLVARTYKRPVYLDASPPPEGPLVNPAIDWRDIERRYAESEPNVVAVDGLLTPPALAALRQFCLESTFWNNIKPGYLGAYFFDGFCSELLLRIAFELRDRLPGVMRRSPLQMMWGYKCESRLPGLAAHADDAAVNVNFWITGDESNLDPAHGGLLVYPQTPPRDWGFAKYNKADARAIQAWLDASGQTPLCVPYRANRAVIFDSDLFHATDRPVFREGYVDRRVNITMLYGQRSM
jgi:Tfp pilus assembly protein PilF